MSGIRLGSPKVPEIWRQASTNSWFLENMHGVSEQRQVSFAVLCLQLHKFLNFLRFPILTFRLWQHIRSSSLQSAEASSTPKYEFPCSQISFQEGMLEWCGNRIFCEASSNSSKGSHQTSNNAWRHPFCEVFRGIWREYVAFRGESLSEELWKVSKLASF